eukprot:3272487-Prorocentrum_lima.AAC.1
MSWGGAMCALEVSYGSVGGGDQLSKERIVSWEWSYVRARSEFWFKIGRWVRTRAKRVLRSLVTS